VKGMQLTAPDIQAHNTFANPNAVVLKDATVGAVQNGILAHRFPPASVTRLQVTLT
jgi:alpha-N-arabinofuranosidase